MLPDGTERSYSLLDPPSGSSSYIIAVKLERNGRGGSRYIHSLTPGEKVQLLEPRNNFELSTDSEPAIFIAGGIGITPIWCMMQERRAQGLPWQLIYACRSKADAVFYQEMANEPFVSLHFDDENEGRPLDLLTIVSDAPDSAHLYCCGPIPMLEAFKTAVEGRPPHTVHVEYFSPTQEAATQGGFTVHLAKSDRDIAVKPGQSILTALRNGGVDVPFSCEEGTCGACEVHVLSGTPDHRDAVLTEEEREAGETMMVCCSGSLSAVLTLDL
ncbi:MAG: PDR/VanB family oxidoreductase [Novosphingobium sp.]